MMEDISAWIFNFTSECAPVPYNPNPNPNPNPTHVPFVYER